MCCEVSVMDLLKTLKLCGFISVHILGINLHFDAYKFKYDPEIMLLENEFYTILQF